MLLPQFCYFLKNFSLIFLFITYSIPSIEMSIPNEKKENYFPKVKATITESPLRLDQNQKQNQSTWTAPSEIGDNNSNFIKFHIPFTDIQLQNVKNLHISKDKNFGISVLINNIELYHINVSNIVSGDSNDSLVANESFNVAKKWKFVTKLKLDLKNDENVTDFKTISLDSNRIIVIVLYENFLHVYEINISSSDNHSEKNDKDLVTYPVQKIQFNGQYRKMEVLSLSSSLYDDIIMVIITDLAENYNQLSIYQWQSSYFHLKNDHFLLSPKADKIDFLSIVDDNNTERRTLIILTIKYNYQDRNEKALVQLFELQDRLQKIQNFYIKSSINSFHSYIFQNNIFFLINHAPNKMQTIYKLNKLNLYEIQKFHEDDLHSKYEFKKLKSDGQFLVTVNDEERQLYAYLEPKLMCYSTFKWKPTLNVLDIETFQNDNYYIILHYIENSNRKNSTRIIRIVQIQFDNVSVFNNVGNGRNNCDNYISVSHQNSIVRLKSMLQLKALQLFELKRSMLPLMNNFHISPPSSTSLSTKIETSLPVLIKSGHIHEIKINLNSENKNKSKTPNQIRQKLLEIKTNLEIMAKIKTDRFKRATSVRNQNFKTIHAKNLIYNGTIYEGIQRTTNNNLIINVSLAIENLRAKTFKIQPNFHNRSASSHANSKKLSVNITQINNLKKINSIDWNKLQNETFRRGKDKTIYGNLILLGPANIKNLNLKNLNDVPTNNFFTLTTKQEIYTSITLPSFFVSKSLKTNLINGLDLENDVARIGKNNLIKSPVIIRNMTVSDNLTLLSEDNSNFMRHIFGTSITDFIQIYQGNVKINGKLTLQNVNFDKTESKILIDKKPFNIFDIESLYWTKSGNQTFIDDVIINSPAQLNSIQIISLNNYPITKYLNKNSKKSDTALLLFNGTTKIFGNVYTNLPSKIIQMNIDALRYGEVVKIISGKKYFEKPLSTNNLKVRKINNLSIDSLMLHKNRTTSHPHHNGNNNNVSSSFLYFQNKQNFKNLYVKNNFEVNGNLNLKLLNSKYNIEHFFTKTLSDFRENYDNIRRNLKSVIFKNSTKIQGNINFEYLNGYEISKFFKLFEKRFDKKEISFILHKNILIDKNAKFSKDLHLKSINNINWIDYEKLLIWSNDIADTEQNLQIGGIKKFQNSITVTDNLNCNLINGIKFNEQLYKNIFTKSESQTIYSKWQFNNRIDIRRLRAQKLNGITIENLINTESLNSRNELNIESNLIVKNLKVSKSLYGKVMDFDMNLLGNFENFIENLFNTKKNELKEITILESTKIADSSNTNGINLLDNLIENAVTVNGSKQTITGPVKFSNKIRFINVRSASDQNTSVPLNVYIDGIDLTEILNDCLLKNSTKPQQIRGPIEFKNSIEVDILINKNHDNFLGIEILNKVDVLGFNSSIYRLFPMNPSNDFVIFSRKKFKIGPIIGNLNLQNNHLDDAVLINGVNLKNIVYMSNDNDHDNIQLPSIHLQRNSNIFIENNLQVKEVKHMNLDYFLRNRVRLHGKAQEIFGYLTFENLKLLKTIKITGINRVKIDDIVINNSDQLQEIDIPTVINGTLTLIGPASVVHLNNHDLIEKYQNTLLSTKDYHFNRLKMNNIQLTDSKQLHINGTVNGLKILNSDKNEHLKQIEMKINKLKTLINNFSKFNCTERNSRDLIDDNTNNIKKIRYLEYDKNFQIIWNKTIDNNNQINRLIKLYEPKLLKDMMHNDQNNCIDQYNVLDIRLTSFNRIYINYDQNSKYIEKILNKFKVQIENNCNKKHAISTTNLFIEWQQSLRNTFHFNQSYVNNFWLYENLNNLQVYNNDVLYILINFINSNRTSSINLYRIDVINDKLNLHLKQIILLSSSKPINFYNFDLNKFLILHSTVYSNLNSNIQIYKFDSRTEEFKYFKEINNINSYNNNHDHNDNKHTSNNNFSYYTNYLIEIEEIIKNFYYNLIVTCKLNCNQIKIYDFYTILNDKNNNLKDVIKYQAEQFTKIQLKQIINYNLTIIKNIQSNLKINNDNYLLVITKTGNLDYIHLYKYKLNPFVIFTDNSNGLPLGNEWKYITDGTNESIKYVIPFQIKYNSYYLLLVDDNHIIKVIHFYIA